jgi:5'-3' exonuclease
VLRSSEWVCEKYHCRLAEGVWAYKALVGEPGDGVPGVPQIGPVKAKKLLAAYSTISGMADAGALGEHAEWARAAVRLIAPRTDVPLDPVQPSACKLRAEVSA